MPRTFVEAPGSLSSSDVNAYLRDVAGDGFTAKDFRTWAGTVEAACALDEVGPATNATVATRQIVAAVDRVAGVLGNTRAVCRKCYVHPGVLDAYTRGITLSSVEPERAGAAADLRPAEARLVALLRRMARITAAEDARPTPHAAGRRVPIAPAPGHRQRVDRDQCRRADAPGRRAFRSFVRHPRDGRAGAGCGASRRETGGRCRRWRPGH